MTAPAVRVGVFQLLLMQQHSALFQQLDNRRIGIEDPLTLVLRKAVMNDAGFIHIGRQIEFVLHPGGKVVCAVRGSCMHHAGTLVHSDVIGQHSQYLLLLPR